MFDAHSFTFATDEEPAAVKPKIAAGVIFRAPSGKVLLLKRSPTEKNYAGHWALPGGKADPGENAQACAERECEEEIGWEPQTALRLLGTKPTPNGMEFSTFETDADEEFTPTLNAEHTEAGWFAPDELPSPIHPAVAEALGRPPETAADHFALDRASERRYDVDGHLHLARTPISKANVCPYLGREIPGWRELGLDSEKIYRLFRDPEELRKGAATFNNKPLLSKHVPVTADDHHPELRVGSLGTDAEYDHPYLYNSLAVHTRDAIDRIEDDSQKELSSAYRYRADMTPGEYLGQRYDGVMRDIVGNHVALVPEGRAGSDVVVGDAALPKLMEIIMPNATRALLSRKGSVAYGALLTYLQPKMAQDAKVDLTPVLKGVTSKNFKAETPRMIAAIGKAVQGKLAQDANIEDVAQLLDALKEVNVEEAAPGVEATPKPGLATPLPVKTKADDGELDDDADGDAAAMEFLASKLSPEDLAQYQSLCGGAPATDETLIIPDKDKKVPGMDKDGPQMKPDMVTKTAMDAAIRTAVAKVQKDQAALRKAQDDVRPFCGTLACDSAEEMYRTALEANDVDLTDVHPSAFPQLLRLLTPPDKRAAPRIAMDAASSKSFADRFSGAGDIRVL